MARGAGPDPAIVTPAPDATRTVTELDDNAATSRGGSGCESGPPGPPAGVDAGIEGPENACPRADRSPNPPPRASATNEASINPGTIVAIPMPLFSKALVTGLRS